MALVMAASMSASLAAAGRYVSMIASSLVSFSASSGRLPLVNWSMDSLRCFDESLQELDGFGFVDRADFFGFFVGDGGLDAAEDGEAEFVFGAHGVDEVFLDFFGESHGRNIAEERVEVDGRDVTNAQGSRRANLTYAVATSTLEVDALSGQAEFGVERSGGVFAGPDVELFGFDYPFLCGGAPELEFVRA